MIAASDFLVEAKAALTRTAAPTEAELRRAISTAYYGLFHLLIEQASGLFAPLDPRLRGQISRAYSHGTMRKTREEFWRGRSGRFSPPLDALVTGPLDARLATIASDFLQLQEARQIADYDLSDTLNYSYAIEKVEQAHSAAQMLISIDHLPQTAVFLTALLLGDRWTRRG